MIGTVTQVRDLPVGSDLDLDAHSGDSLITVSDVGAFAWQGAQLVFPDGVVYAYTVSDADNSSAEVELNDDLDPDSGTLALSTPLAADYDAGTKVALYPKTYERTVFVGGEDIEGELAVRVPSQLQTSFLPGIRNPSTAEVIQYEEDDSGYVMGDSIGERPVVDPQYLDTAINPVSDDEPPASSPTPVLTGGPGFIAATWDAVANADLVTYEVHLSVTSGFTPSSTTFYADVTGTGAVMDHLPADGSDLSSATTYYVKLIAKDVNGPAPTGAQASGSPSAILADPDGSPPASSPTPTVNGGPTYLAARWTPVANHDLVTYEVHVSVTTGFTPSGGTKFGESVGASIIIDKTAGGSALAAGTTYFVKLIAKDADGSAAAGSQGSGQIVPLPSSAQTSDAAAPGSSPTPTVLGGIGILLAKWTPITNNDFVTYEVHISTTTGFTPSGATKVGETAAGSFVIRLDGAGAALVYGTTYYVKIVAKDSDGSAAASAQGSGTLVKAVGGSTGDVATGTILATNVGSDTLTAAEIATNAVTAAELAANSVTAADMLANTITASQVATDTLTANEIAANGITASELAANSVTAADMLANTITAGQIAGDTITAAEIHADAITASELAANSITAADMLAHTVTATQIFGDTITAAEIATNAITATELAANSITAGDMLANTITAAQILAGTITATELAAGSVTAAKIVAGTITTTELSATAIDAMTITGATFQTSSSLTTARLVLGGVLNDFSVRDNTNTKLVVLDTSGLWLRAGGGATVDPAKAVEWKSSGGVARSWAFGYESAFVNSLGIYADAVTSKATLVELDATGATGEANLQLIASGVSSSVEGFVFDATTVHGYTVLNGGMESSFMALAGAIDASGAGGTPSKKSIDWGSNTLNGTGANTAAKNVSHACYGAPISAIACSRNAQYTAKVTAVNSSQITVTIRKDDGTTFGAGVSVDFFWMAIG